MHPLLPALLLASGSACLASGPVEAPTRPLVPPASDSVESGGLHARLGLLAFQHGVGLQVGALVREGRIALGLDGWIRPWAWPREVRTSPGRRSRHQELLYGFAPWVAYEFELGRGSGDARPWSLAPVASLDIVDGFWYGTAREPRADLSPSAGLRVSPPGPLRLGLRRSFGRDELAGDWKGDVSCEF